MYLYMHTAFTLFLSHLSYVLKTDTFVLNLITVNNIL